MFSISFIVVCREWKLRIMFSKRIMTFLTDMGYTQKGVGKSGDMKLRAVGVHYPPYINILVRSV
jgi:hypothetical protein